MLILCLVAGDMLCGIKSFTNQSFTTIASPQQCRRSRSHRSRRTHILPLPLIVLQQKPDTPGVPGGPVTTRAGICEKLCVNLLCCPWYLACCLCIISPPPCLPKTSQYHYTATEWDEVAPLDRMCICFECCCYGKHVSYYCDTRCGQAGYRVDRCCGRVYSCIDACFEPTGEQIQKPIEIEMSRMSA